MSSQHLVGKELCRIGRAVLDLVRSRHLSSVGAGGFTRSSLVALGIFCALARGGHRRALPFDPRRDAFGRTQPGAQNRSGASARPEKPDGGNRIGGRAHLARHLRAACRDSHVASRAPFDSRSAGSGLHHPAPRGGALTYPHAGQFVSAVAREDGKLGI